MGARFVRAAIPAMLSAVMLLGLRVNAQPVSNVRLEPARIFSPISESLLGSLDGEIHDMSLFSASIFNVMPAATIIARQMADLIATGNPAVRIAGANLNGISQEVTYTPHLRTPSISAPNLSVRENTDTSVPADSAQSVASLPPMQAPAVAPVHFGTYGTYSPAVQTVAANMSVPMRVGNVHFNGMMSGTQAQSPQSDAFRAMQICGTTDEAAACPYLRDAAAQSLSVGTNFSLRAGNDNLNLQLSSSVARVSTGEAAIFPYVPVDPDAQLNENFNAAGPDASILQYAGVTDVVKHAVGASLAVPVSNRITVGLQYDRSHYQGDYGNELLPAVDAYKDTYLGNLSYQLPNTSSMLTLSARQYRYQDSISPNFNLTETRADLNFTVKF